MLVCSYDFWMSRLLLAEMLKQKKISKRELAKRAGIKYENIFKCFRPGYDPKFSTLVRLAKAFGCSVRRLIED